MFGDFVGKGQPVGYHVCKAGLNQLMRYYAVNLGRKGIRVNAVTAFTYLKDESKDFYLGNEDLLGLYERIVPLGRMATAQDCARAAAFLCSPEAGFVNGQNLYVDGGLSLVWPETLARDLAQLHKYSFRVAELQPVDMFPQTPHIETVARLVAR